MQAAERCPTRKAFQASSKVLFMGLAVDGLHVRFAIGDDKDSSYGSTSKMIGDAVICLVREAPEDPGGVWTPGAALGRRLIDRLPAHAGMTFAVES